MSWRLVYTKRASYEGIESILYHVGRDETKGPALASQMP